MTGIMVVPGGDAVAIASDGAVHDPNTGFLLGSASKVVLIPECSCVMTQRGISGFGQALRFRLGMPRDYDDILSLVEQVAVGVTTEFVQNAPLEPHWSMTICGWSNARSRFEINALRSRDYFMRNELTGGVDTIPAHTLYPIEGIVMSPIPNLELRRRFGIDFDNIENHEAVELSQRLLCAARFCEEPNDEATGKQSNFTIGCYLQSTILRQDRIESRIVHRWPDPIGEKIDPKRGEALPPFLAVT